MVYKTHIDALYYRLITYIRSFLIMCSSYKRKYSQILTAFSLKHEADWPWLVSWRRQISLPNKPARRVSARRTSGKSLKWVHKELYRIKANQDSALLINSRDDETQATLLYAEAFCQYLPLSRRNYLSHRKFQEALDKTMGFGTLWEFCHSLPLLLAKHEDHVEFMAPRKLLILGCRRYGNT